MNSIQKYVLNSLFVRNQITEEKLAQALDTFSNESAIDAFLSVLITGEETKKDVLLTIIGTATRRVQVIKILKDLFSTGLKETKDLVDMYTDDKLSVTKIPMKKLYTEANSLHSPNYNKTRRIANLMTGFSHNIILIAFVWSKTDEGYDFWYDIYKKVQLI